MSASDKLLIEAAEKAVREILFHDNKFRKGFLTARQRIWTTRRPTKKDIQAAFCDHLSADIVDAVIKALSNKESDNG